MTDELLDKPGQDFLQQFATGTEKQWTMWAGAGGGASAIDDTYQLNQAIRIAATQRSGLGKTTSLTNKDAERVDAEMIRIQTALAKGDRIAF